jgi:hypothetical protein
MTNVLHNMSVPTTSRITLARACHPGLRFRVGLASQTSQPCEALRDKLARGGWRAAWEVLDLVGCAPPEGDVARHRPEALRRHLEAVLREAGVPARVGVFLDEDVKAATGALLSPAAALAVLARRSGPLYLPSRRLEPSLADPKPLVLFFPE